MASTCLSDPGNFPAFPGEWTPLGGAKGFNTLVKSCQISLRFLVVFAAPGAPSRCLQGAGREQAARPLEHSE